MSKSYFIRCFFLGGIAFSIISCQDDEQIAQPEQAVSIDGYVQKGPFINGTAITVSELNQKLVATGKNFTTQTTDNKGSFSLGGVELQSDFVQLMANGFYFDEVIGEKSIAPLTLFALANTSAVSIVNINLLSHLEKDRVIHLMQEENKSFATAKKQAQREVLAVFGIKKDDIVPSEQLDISQEGEDNAILLAVSVILQGYGSVADLSELLANISGDLKPDGILNDSILGSHLIDNAFYLDLEAIRENIVDRYQELGDIIVVGDFEKYIQQFISGSGFQITRRIEYPIQGFYGENLLSDAKLRYPKTTGGINNRYDIYAILPVGTKLKVRISSHLKYPENLAWSYSDTEGWVFTDFNESDQSRVFTTAKYGEVKMWFDLSDDIKIEIYEQNAIVPTRVKNIDTY